MIDNEIEKKKVFVETYGCRMNYKEALDYLDSFLNYEKTTAYCYPDAFSLDRVERLLDRLGNPHRRYATLHVAGTKGKGSTCAFAAGILQAAGFRTGLYTSPHLLSFRERFRIDGRPVSEQELAEVVAQVRPAASPDLTFFEVTTACAFLCFARAGVEVAVIEVGLGGRLDATNVLAPAVTAITPISRDHMAKLGNTVEKIAAEKAGIIKPGIPVVAAPQPETVLNLLRETASACSAPFHDLSSEVRMERVSVSVRGSEVSFRTPERFYAGLQIPLLGRHQLANAATAVRMVELLGNSDRRFTVASGHVREGLGAVDWPGRCQFFEGRPPILLDGAQNAASAEVLKATVTELFPGKRIWLVFGSSVEKDLEGIASVLGRWAERLILTQACLPRAESAAVIREAFRRWHPDPQVEPSVAEALQRARAEAASEALIVVTGSLFVVAEALEIIGGVSSPEKGFRQSSRTGSGSWHRSVTATAPRSARCRSVSSAGSSPLPGPPSR